MNRSFRSSVTLMLGSSYIIQFSIMAISLVSKGFLARLLSKEDFGLFAMAVFVNLICSNIISWGFGKHLIREEYKKWGNGFLVQLSLALLFVSVFQIFPNIISVYDGSIKDVMRIFSFNLIFLAINSFFHTYFLKELKLNKMIFILIFSTSVYVVSVIFLAYKGYGVWSLIYSTMLAEIIKTLYLFFFHWKDLREKIEFTFKYTAQLMKGAFLLFLILVIGNFYNYIHTALIGKILTPEYVGMFYMAYQVLVLFPEKMISKAFREVLYPVFAACKDNRNRVQKVIKYATLSVVAVEVFIYTTFFIFADLLVRLAFGPKWLDIVPLFRFICFIPIVFPFGKYLEGLIITAKKEIWNLIGISFNLVLTIVLGIILIPIYKNEGMGIIRYISAFVNIIPIYITIKKLKYKVFFKEYLLVYLPILSIAITPLSLKLRLTLLPALILFYGIVAFFEYKIIFSDFISISKIKDKFLKKKNVIDQTDI